MNSTFGEVMTVFENGTQPSETLDSAAMLRTASLLFCQREVLLNETSEEKQYFNKYRPNQQTLSDGVDNSSTNTYVYDNSTSESVCLFVMHAVNYHLKLSEAWRADVIS